MPKQRSPDRDKAFEIYKERDGNVPLVDIAAQLSVSEGTVRGWKNKDNWDYRLNGTLRKNTERSNKNMERSNPTNKKIDIDRKLLESVEENPRLTEKQKLFCVFYLENFNATLAAIKAGYSPDSARALGYENLTKPYIKNEIKKLKEVKSESLMLDQDDIVEKYMNIAFANIDDFVNFGNEEVKEIDEAGNEHKYKRNFANFKDNRLVDGGLISEISVGKNGSSIKLKDSMKALEWLSKYFMMNPMDKHKIEYDNRCIDLNKQKLEAYKDKIAGRIDLDNIITEEDL